MFWGKKADVVEGVPIDQVLWGGPRGEGLVTTVARLATTSERLNESVSRLTEKVLGSEGLQVEVNELKNEIMTTKARVDAIYSFGKWALLAFWGLLVPGILAVAATAIRTTLATPVHP